MDGEAALAFLKISFTAFKCREGDQKVGGGVRRWWLLLLENTAKGMVLEPPGGVTIEHLRVNYAPQGQRVHKDSGNQLCSSVFFLKEEEEEEEEDEADDDEGAIPTFSDSPTHLENSSGPLTAIKLRDDSVARAFAIMVLLQPGGP
jgi:hypothetical protein